MGSEQIALGRAGEEAAARYLTSQGLRIVERNWRCRLGEIDIVASDGDTLVICEVKTRTTDRFGTPLAAVTPTKVRRLRRLAGLWLEAHADRPKRVRLDVVGILLHGPKAPLLEHVREVG